MKIVSLSFRTQKKKLFFSVRILRGIPVTYGTSSRDNCPQRRCYFLTGPIWVQMQSRQNQLKVPHRLCTQVSTLTISEIKHQTGILLAYSIILHLKYIYYRFEHLKYEKSSLIHLTPRCLRFPK